MGSFSLVHWLVVLAIVILVFGTSRLKNVGKDLGGAIRGFKEGMRGDEDASKPAEPTQKPADSTGRIIDHDQK